MKKPAPAQQLAALIKDFRELQKRMLPKDREIAQATAKAVLLGQLRDKAEAERDQLRADIAIEMGELQKYKDRFKWLAEPLNVFQYIISADGHVNVGTRFNFVWYKTLEDAIDAEMAKQKKKA